MKVRQITKSQKVKKTTVSLLEGIELISALERVKRLLTSKAVKKSAIATEVYSYYNHCLQNFSLGSVVLSKKESSHRIAAQSPSDILPAIIQDMVRRSWTIRSHAKAPYSHFLVGAGLLSFNAEVTDGVNVESSSYGLSVCAERSALVSALSQGLDRFCLIVLCADTEEPVSPCGACRQLLLDYAPDAVVLMHNGSGAMHICLVRDLLPYAFDQTQLVSKKNSK